MAPAANTSGMEFEVFLSFRGPDTRNNFTSCLYHDMVEKGIRVFKDDEELRIGQQIGGNLLGALDDTQIYIPIFSKGFASSVWCLREVAHMVDCTSKSDGKKEIRPIFFDVEPDDVKLKTNLYRDALFEHEKKYSSREVKSWGDALVEVPTRVGWKLEGKGYGELIKLIVREVLLKLKGKNRPLPDHLVETDDLTYIEKLLDVGSDDHVRFVILHGTGGIGKSTLASVIFNRFRSKFNCSTFLGDVQSHGLLDMQKKLLSETLGSNSAQEIYDTNDGIDHIMRGLGKKKVLVVVDNVDEKKQLENLAGSCDWFGCGSRIIVTLRDLRTIRNKDNQKRRSNYMEYSVKEMPFGHAIQLFSKHAFRSNTTPKDCYKFSKEVVSSIGKLPLTLEVVGSLFANTVRSEWEERLEELKRTPYKDIRQTLMISINKLDDIEKAIFLDIACFCIGEDRTYADYMWRSSDYSPRSAIDVLLLMSLIKIEVYNNKFWMHDEVRDLGRYIVKQENFENAGARRWVRIDEDTLNILRSNEEKRAVRALNLSVSHNLTPKELACLSMLKFLGGIRLNFIGNFENLLCNLRWLSWHCCPADFLAMNLHLVNLVVLDLSKSKITHDWGGWRQIEMAKNLKVLDLTCCLELTKTPDFSEFGKLEKLILCGCNALSTMDSSIGKLKLLSTLNIDGCNSLQGLLEEIGSLECLSEIILPYFNHPIKLPETLGNLKSLLKFETQADINQVPHSIGELNLTDLVLNECDNLYELPDSIGKLESLVKLDLCASGISILPYSIGRLKNLEYLLLAFCDNLHELPDSIGELKSLVELNLYSSGVFILPDSIGRLKNLKHLLLPECKNLLELPNFIGELESLVRLDLTFSGLFVLPDSIGILMNFTDLYFSDYGDALMLESFVGEPKSEIKLDLNLHGICILLDSIGRLTSIMHLSFFGCKNLHKLPDSIGELKSLVELNLDSSGIFILPDFIARLKNLKLLILFGCKNLFELPNFIGELESSVILNLTFSRLFVLPDSIGILTNFTHLSFFDYGNALKLESFVGEPKLEFKLDLNLHWICNLLDSVGRLTRFTHLSFSGCKNLHELPDSIGELKSLVELNLDSSGIFILSDSIGRLKNLKHLLLCGCKNLLELPNFIGELESLVKLDLTFSGLFVFPDSIGILMNITHLSFSDYGNALMLESFVGEPKSKIKLDLNLHGICILLDSIGRLTSITHLSFSGCKNLHKLPEFIGQMELLVELNLKSSGISLLPDFIGHLKRLKVLNVAYTKIHTIPCTLGGVETLEELGASFCPHLMDEIPWKMWSLTRLRILDFDGSPISTVPRMIDGFSSLQTLKIASCRLSPLPMLPSSLKCLVVAAAEFPVLPDLSNLVHLHHLEVRHLEVLTLGMTFWVPANVTSPWEDVQSINRLPLSLSTLKLHYIPQLPDNFNFQSLSILSISKCLTAHLPALSHLKGLQELWLSDFPELVEIPGLGELELLMFLHIAMCDVIKQLPNLSKLKNLLRLEVKHCAKLRAVEDLTELKILKNVEIRYCMSLEKLPDVSASTKLETDWTPPKPAEHTIQPAK